MCLPLCISRRASENSCTQHACERPSSQANAALPLQSLRATRVPWSSRRVVSTPHGGVWVYIAPCTLPQPGARAHSAQTFRAIHQCLQYIRQTYWRYRSDDFTPSSVLQHVQPKLGAKREAFGALCTLLALLLISPDLSHSNSVSGKSVAIITWRCNKSPFEPWLPAEPSFGRNLSSGGSDHQLHCLAAPSPHQ